MLNKLWKYKIISNVVACCVEMRGLVRIPARCLVGGYSVLHVNSLITNSVQILLGVCGFMSLQADDFFF